MWNEKRDKHVKNDDDSSEPPVEQVVHLELEYEPPIDHMWERTLNSFNLDLWYSRSTTAKNLSVIRLRAQI